ncbi:uncharacterized protein LOC122639079 [Telopea speciosissima]|nr:uncharacterized protein LOC122639079 [Telopea speciosissima]
MAVVLRICASSFDVAILDTQRSQSEMDNLKGFSKESLELQIKEMKTWLSTAFTNEEKCANLLGNLPNGPLTLDAYNLAVTGKKFTSIALGLMNKWSTEVAPLVADSDRP